MAYASRRRARRLGVAGDQMPGIALVQMFEGETRTGTGLQRLLTQVVGLYFPMPTVFIMHGVRYVVYPNDHAPPHVHGLGAGWEIVVTLGDGHQVKPSIRGMKGEPTVRQIALVLQTTHLRCAELFRHWREIHGY